MQNDTAFIIRVQQVLREQVAPALDLNPAGLEVLAIENGIVTVRMTDICASCPASLPAIVMQMEQELRQHVPEIEIIEPVA